MTEPQKNDRTWLYVGVAFAIFWAVYLIFFNGGSSRAPSLDPPEFPAAVDYNWNLVDPDGKPVSFGEFRGKTVLLNFWATWCPPCRAEMPSLAKLAADPKLASVVFIGVTDELPSSKVANYARGEMQGIRVLHATDVPASLAGNAIPRTYIIAPDGMIVSADTGAARWDHPGVVEFLQKINKLPKP